MKYILILNYKQPMNTIIKFSAPWCWPCQQYKPVFDAVKNSHFAEAEFLEVDVDSNQEEAIKYRVMSVPTTIVIKDWQLIESITWPLSKEYLTELIYK